MIDLLRKIFLSPRRVSPFLAWGDFHARSRFARSTIPEEKWGASRSLVMLSNHSRRSCGKTGDCKQSSSDCEQYLVSFRFAEGSTGTCERRASKPPDARNAGGSPFSHARGYCCVSLDGLRKKRYCS